MIKTVIVEDDLMVAEINNQFAMKTPRIQIAATFHNGTDALHFLSETHVDLLLLDLYMPGFSGLELLRELRRQKNDVDVIMITAANNAEHIKEALQLGITDYLIKPFKYERFSEALDKYLLKHKLMQTGMDFSQSDVDQLLNNRHLSEKSKEIELQKGLQRKTLDLISDCLHEHKGEYLTSEFIATSVNLSQVTTRRYLNYLVETDIIKSRIDYSTGGRPCMEYMLI